MIDADDASRVAGVVAENLAAVSKNKANFEKLPDAFWGYFARGHDSKGAFGVFVMYSENASDVDETLKLYEEWASKQKPSIK